MTAAARLHSPPALPALRDGDRMMQPEFHRRYSAMPANTRAELINGVVHMGSPLHARHGRPDGRMAALLAVCCDNTPGLDFSLNTTTILGLHTEVQPDLWLRIVEECGGTSHMPDEDGVLIGPPELVVEVSDSTLPVDLTVKKAAYREAGVSEYLVLDVRGKRLLAFDLGENGEQALTKGTWKSRVFPGLWIDVAAVFRRDTKAALARLDEGLTSKAHAKFAAGLAGRLAEGRKKTGT